MPKVEIGATIGDRRNGAQGSVRFGSKANIRACPSNVRFTPKSGHQTDPRYVRRNNFGSLAILVAIRRCGPQLTERTRATNSGVCIYADGTLSQQEQIAAARRL